MSSAQPKKASRGGPPAVRSSGTEPPAGGVATIVDVARAAGVSISTVSRVLNANTQVDPRMAAKVIRAAQDLKYQPSRVARSLRLRHNRVWAMVISDIRTGPFFADLVRGVEDVAYESGYSMFLCNADEDPLKEAAYLSLAVAENVAGVILTPSGSETDLSLLMSAGIHVVLADRRLRDPRADTVVADNVSGAEQAVGHLVSNGYSRIACITGPLSTTTASERFLGYRNALSHAGRPLDDALVRVADFRESGGHLAMQQLLEESHRPDAVFVSNNRMAIGALQAIDESGLTIPGDVGVVGYDDIAWVGLMRTPLTTVSSPAYDLGLESGRLLLSRIEGFTGAPRTVVLSPSLIVGASSAPKAITRRGPRRSGAVRT